ncbi:MAG: hypothetical protein R3E61_09330 [Pseudomonadales bacterium]
MRTLWCDPLSLDPTRQSAKVTREIAAQLAGIRESIGKRELVPNAWLDFSRAACSHFLLKMLACCRSVRSLNYWNHSPTHYWQFMPLVTRFGRKTMDGGGFTVSLRADVLRFNGKLFKQQMCCRWIHRDQIALLN